MYFFLLFGAMDGGDIGTLDWCFVLFCFVTSFNRYQINWNCTRLEIENGKSKDAPPRREKGSLREWNGLLRT
jgi:hypothetical protein